MSYIGQTHLKMITRARAIYLVKIKTTEHDLGIRLLLDFLKSDSTALERTSPPVYCLSTIFLKEIILRNADGGNLVMLLFV